MGDTTRTVKQLLMLQAHALHAQADALVAMADALPDAGIDGDPLLSTAETLERFGYGREAIRAAVERGELSVQKGARGKYLVLESEMRRYIASRPLRPAPRRAPAPPDLDAWERAVDRDLQLVGGCSQ